MVYTVTCNPALDYVMVLSQLQPNTIHRSEREWLTYGGKGINVSVVLSRLSVPTTALGFVAGYMGDKLCSLIAEEGVTCDFVRLSQGETRINVKLRTDAEWDVNASGPPINDSEREQLFDKLDTLCANDILVLAGSVPKGLPEDLYVRLLARVQHRGVLTVVDAEGDLLRKTLPFRPFLIKPNSHELGALFGKSLQSQEEVIRHARLLQDEGARNVLVSCGGDGAVLVDEHGCVHSVDAVRGEVRNTVGCGDSMVAGFLAGWLQTSEYAAALRLGAACGSATAFSETLATRSEIEQVAANIYMRG